MKVSATLFQSLVLALALPLCTGCLKVDNDTAALRDTVVKGREGRWSKRFELGIGSIPFALVRAGLSFVELDPEPRAVVQALRGAGVAVYERHDQIESFQPATQLAEADRTMAERGWDRLVGVIDGQEVVAVYAPEEFPSARRVRFCVLVISRDELVIASARGDPRPLLDLAWNHLREERPSEL